MYWHSRDRCSNLESRQILDGITDDCMIDGSHVEDRLRLLKRSPG